MATAMQGVWRRCDTDPAPEGVEVQTRSPNGMEQTLVRHGRLWFTDTHRSMYVYYTPLFWRPIEEK